MVVAQYARQVRANGTERAVAQCTDGIYGAYGEALDTAFDMLGRHASPAESEAIARKVAGLQTALAAEIASRRITVRRRYAVWLEDAIEVDAPEGVHPDDLDDWAFDNWDDLYASAIEQRDRAEIGAERTSDNALLWENDHKADLEFPEPEVTVDKR